MALEDVGLPLQGGRQSQSTQNSRPLPMLLVHVRSQPQSPETQHGSRPPTMTVRKTNSSPGQVARLAGASSSSPRDRGFDPQSGAYRSQPIAVSLTLINIYLSIPPFPPAPLKISKYIFSGEDLKKKKNSKNKTLYLPSQATLSTAEEQRTEMPEVQLEEEGARSAPVPAHTEKNSGSCGQRAASPRAGSREQDVPRPATTAAPAQQSDQHERTLGLFTTGQPRDKWEGQRKPTSASSAHPPTRATDLTRSQILENRGYGSHGPYHPSISQTRLGMKNNNTRESKRSPVLAQHPGS